jgi:NitT/TauT family transport system substrate-binding protein
MLWLAVCGLTACRAESPAADPPHARLRLSSLRHLSQGPLLLAEAEGYFRDEGIEIELIPSRDHRDMLPMLLSGDLDVLAANLSPIFLSAIAQGANLRIVADKGRLSRDGCTYLAFLARPELVRDGRLTRPAERPRWQVSYRPSSIFELLFERARDSAGIDPREVELFHLSDLTESQALAQGRLDVALVTGAPMQALLEAGEAVIWRRGEELMPDGQLLVLFYGPSLLERDREAGVRFMTAFLRGVRQYQLGKTARNVEVLAAGVGATPEQVERSCWIGMSADGRIDLDSLTAVEEWSRAKGIHRRALTVEEVWDPSFLESAARRLDRPAGSPGRGS